MSILDRLRQLLGRDVHVYYGNSHIEDPIVESMSPKDLYMTQANLYSVVSFLASSVAQLPIKVYDRQAENVRVRDRNSKAAKLLFRPNSDQTQAEFVKALCIEYLLYGEALVWLLPDNSESGYQLRLIPSEWIVERKCETNFATSQYRVRTTTGGDIYIDANQIIEFREYAPGLPASHLSPVSALKQTLIEQIQADKFRASLWRSSGRMNAYITRPANVQPWTAEARDAWTDAFRRGWSAGGSKAGSMPVLEDGMEIKSYQFNSKEAEFSTGKQLSREDVAAAYHVNPSLIWHTTTQTYASSKDNARALYAECLGPLLQVFQQRINSFLLPKIDASSNLYVEFDLEEKLKGSFEERASIIQSAVGGPWMTRNEARAMNNMAPIPDGDEVITPLNVMLGGQASPQDSVADIYKDAEPKTKAKNEDEPKHEDIKIDATPDEDDCEEMSDILAKFFERQRKSIMPKIGAKAGIADWWDKERWDKELFQDVYNYAKKLAKKKGTSVAKLLNAVYHDEITDAYMTKMYQELAESINETTYDNLSQTMSIGDHTSDDIAKVFDTRINKDAMIIGSQLATRAYKFATNEAMQQAQNQGKMEHTRVVKTWVTGPNARDSHAIMDGETVDIDDKFSNGADWVHDDLALGPDETCGCNCHIEVSIIRE